MLSGSELNDVESDQYTIAIQPIVNVQLQHVADELLYRGNASAGNAVILDAVQATARACAVAIYEIGLDKLCGQRQLFINASHDWLLNPDLAGLPADQIVIEILEDTQPSEPLTDALRRLKKQGYRLALDDVEPNSANQGLMPFADIVKFDISVGLPIDMITSLHRQGYTLLAERVETHDEFEQCKALGFSLFQGYFYQRPQIQTTRTQRHSTSRANQMQLLAQLYSDRVRLPALSTLIARDPYLLNAVFKRANSAGKAAQRPAYKLLDCVHIIGLKELRTLVSIVMLAGNNPASKVNLINGLTRAFACEALAEQRGLDAEEAFIVGLFSRMPVILGIELEVMLQELPLSQSIHKALASYAGALGQLLVDIAACEQGAVLTSVPAEFMLKAAAEARALMDSQLS
ncbi:MULTISPECIES: EAL and HDOD domain-containing protein [Halomonadaceae]|uniref:Histidine kinase n=2 Tax=Halomonadaceae TaxID=28256 RepID=A0A8H9I5W0_9GAMM|nr:MULTISPECIES: EAL domain-containing protein [Halomonas]GGW36307.1 histidine kinase [Halomonas hamiltonii]GGW58038.1 histidine kinase [Halomonas johnsoniae]